jgi:hypothetical protein
MLRISCASLIFVYGFHISIWPAIWDNAGEIKIMRTNNLKDYRKLLKSKNKREEPDIPITSLYDFFKHLNARL